MKNFLKKIKMIAVMAAFLGGTAVSMAALTQSPVMAQENVYKNGAQTGYTIPTEITIKKGETKTITLKTPSGSKDVTNVAWGYQTNGYFDVTGTSHGSYWGKSATITIKGTSAGIGYINADADVLGKKGDPKSYKYTAENKCVVKVIDGDSKTNSKVTRPLQRISLNKTSSVVELGKSTNLSVSYSPSDTTDSKTVYWKSSNTSVATVNGGKVVAKKAGTATITARVGTKTATCKVTVVVPLKSISLSKSSISLKTGENQMLYYTASPSNTTDKGAVTWSSSNTSVASVSGGRVTAKKAGTAVITAKKSGKTATCKVTVTAAQAVKTTKTTTTTVKEGYKNVSEAYSLTNSFRTTRSNQWYWNADNKTKTYTYGLKGLTRDVALENTAKLRAKEQWTQYYVNGKTTHDRPNGRNCFTAYPGGYKYKGENLGWGQTNCREIILDGTKGWAETNKKHADQGHRRAMLNSQFNKVGIACYEKNGKTCWAMCLGS